MGKTQRLKAIDFFCGAGGMSYGFSLAGIKLMAGIDIDEECKETYEKNNPDSKFVATDIKNLSVRKLKKLTGIERNDASMIFVCCSPCQYWTQINTDKTKSSDSKNLLKNFQKFVDHFMPGFIIIENVRGILTNKKKSKLSSFLAFLKKKKYKVAYDIVNAVHYGVPQNRKRFLLIASTILEGIELPDPDKTCCPRVSDFIGINNGFKSIEAGHADESDFLHTTAGLSDKNIRRLKMTPPDGGTRLAWKDAPELQIPTYKGKDDTFKDTYGRMFWNKPAPTITTKFHSVSNGRFAHPEENRGISLREGATLQTFPKTYIFKGSGIGSIARQIGNAVPPELAKRIGLSITDSLDCCIINNSKQNSQYFDKGY